MALDTRPGLLERTFVTKKVNDKGIYAMYLYINGMKRVVHVDDFLPAIKTNRHGRSGWFPKFAQSTEDGEIWPAIAEKVWAKTVGGYGYSSGGLSYYVL